MDADYAHTTLYEVTDDGFSETFSVTGNMARSRGFIAFVEPFSRDVATCSLDWQ